VQSGKVVVFIKPTCPYCRRTQELLSQLPFKQGLLGFFNITDNGDTNEIQDYLQQLTGCIGTCTDLVNMHERGELLRQLKQTGALL
ncbi:hypothetical protein FD754_015618, partial [Muntiacus muntjak]